MSMTPQEVRIPNLPRGQLVDSDGNSTLDFSTFMQTLVTNLQRYFGNEGMVMPSQTAENIALIVANTIPNSGQPDVPLYTCAPGTMIYDSDNDLVKVTKNVAGVPTLFTVTVT